VLIKQRKYIQGADKDLSIDVLPLFTPTACYNSVRRVLIKQRKYIQGTDKDLSIDVLPLFTPTARYNRVRRVLIKQSTFIQGADKDLSIDVLPLFTAADALLQCLNARLHEASKDAVEVDLLTTATNYLVAQLYNTNTHNHTQFVLLNKLIKLTLNVQNLLLLGTSYSIPYMICHAEIKN